MKILFKKYWEIILIYFIFIFIWKYSFLNNFSLIDDHEILFFHYKFSGLNFFEFISNSIQFTELANDSERGRFRPSYYFLRITEVFFYEVNNRIWYFSRLVIYSYFLVSLFLLLKKKFSSILTFLCLLVIITNQNLLDIIPRLGTNELYIILGLAFIFNGLFLIKKINLSSLLINIGVIISAGSKELYVVFIIIPALIIFYNYRRYELKSLIIPTIFFLISISYSCFIVYELLSRIDIFDGQNVYGGKLNLKSYLVLIKKLIISFYVHAILFLIFISILIIKRSKNKYKKEHYMYSFLLISLISLTYFFYQGLGFGPSRYNFIIELFLIIYLFLIIKLIKKIINPEYSKFFIPSLIVISLFLSIMNLEKISKRTKKTYEITNRLFNILNNLDDNMNKYNAEYLVLNSHSWLDYEPILSINTILMLKKFNKKVVVRLDGYSEKDFSDQSLKFRLAAAINSWSKNGMKSEKNMFYPYNEEVLKNCYSLGVGGNSFNKCKNQNSIIW